MLNRISQLSWLGTALVVLGVGAVPVRSGAALATHSDLRDQAQQPTYLAQADTCRQVSSAAGGLNVRQSPSMDAEIVGVVANGRNVSIQSLGAEGWVPITAPLEGFVSARYLTGCDLAIAPPDADLPAEAPTTSSLCREVLPLNGLNVRSEPTVYSSRIGILPNETRVTIEGLGVNGWVPITEPIDGYVSARFIGACS